MSGERRKLPRSLSSREVTPSDDGSVLLSGVPLLAVGEWTDSAVQTPLYYPAETLRTHAENWHDRSVWSRHLGGAPRRITEKIGTVENPRFESDAVTGDIRLHGATQESRDTIEYIRYAQARGEDVWVSVEHGGREALNKATGQWEAKTLDFYGLAVVSRGACESCTLPRSNESAPGDENMEDTIKALEERIVALEGHIKELEKPAEEEPAEDEQVKALADTVAKLTAENTKLADRVKALEETPDPKTRDAGAPEQELDIRYF